MKRSLYTLALLTLFAIGADAQQSLLDKTFGGGDGEVTYAEIGLAKAIAAFRRVEFGAGRLYAYELEERTGNVLVAVLDPDGKPLATVNGGAPVSVPRPTADFFLGYSLAIRPDGGFFLVGNRRNATEIFVYAYRADGTVDASFGTNGKLTFDLKDRNGVPVTNFSGSMTGFGRADGGLAVLLGSVRNNDGSFDYWLNLKPDGTLDAAAAGAGLQLLPFGFVGNARTNGLVRETDGGLVRSIVNNDSFSIERRLPSGALDLSFGTAGSTRFRVRTFANNLRQSIVAAAGGGYYLAALPQDAPRGNRDTTYLPVMKLGTSGKIDLAWGTKGLAYTIGTGTTLSPNKIFARANGGVWVDTDDNIQRAAFAVTSNGALDQSRGGGSRVVYGSSAEVSRRSIEGFDVATERFYLFAAENATRNASYEYPALPHFRPTGSRQLPRQRRPRLRRTTVCRPRLLHREPTLLRPACIRAARRCGRIEARRLRRRCFPWPGAQHRRV